MARQVQDPTAYAAGYRDPVRATNPYTPTELVTSATPANVPIVGVLAIAGAVLLFEHFRRRRGGK